MNLQQKTNPLESLFSVVDFALSVIFAAHCLIYSYTEAAAHTFVLQLETM